MPEITHEDIVSRLDLVQQSVWSTEERVIRANACVAKQQVDVDEIKSSLELINQKLDKLDKEVRALRNGDHENGSFD